MEIDVKKNDVDIIHVHSSSLYASNITDFKLFAIHE